jgi:hypothetical protein
MIGVAGRRPRRRRQFSARAINWTKVGVQLEHHRLLVLQWNDLFSEEGLDTWQVRTSTVRTLLEEFIEATRVAEDHLPHRHALVDIAAEALNALERDEVAKEHYPFLRPSLQELAEKVGTGEPPLADCRRRATVLLGRLRDYREHALAGLRTALKREDAKEKERQLRLTMTVASEFVAAGHSLQHLKTAGELLSAGGKSFTERFESLVQSCPAAPKTHAVYFAVQQWPSGIQPREQRRLRFRPIEDPELPVTQVVVQAFLANAMPESTIAEVKVDAPDPFSARREAERTLASAIAAMAFARFKEPTLKFGDAVVVDPDGKAHSVQPDDSRRKYIKLSADWATRTAEILRLFDELPAEDAQQLNATLQYYRLAISHQTDEVRVVNMWVATENLVSRIGGASIIERVSEYLVPLVASRNVRRVAREFGKQLVSKISYRDLRALGLLDGETVPPASLLRLLRQTDQAAALLGMLNEDPLLRYRLARFAGGALKDGKGAADYIKAHAQNVSWQLRRIYRARNAIVHRGHAPNTLRQLLQHLHAYLWTAIRSLTSDLVNAEGRWTLADALEHRRSLFRYALDVLQTSGSDLPVEALVEPDLFLQMRIGDLGGGGRGTKSGGRVVEKNTGAVGQDRKPEGLLRGDAPSNATESMEDKKP